LTIHAGKAVGRVVDVVRHLRRGDRLRLRDAAIALRAVCSAGLPTWS
jgi:hypothetical protein